MAGAAPHATQPLVITVPGGHVAADLRVPEGAVGVVLFAHGSGSSRFSSRNRAVAGFLEHRRFATLLVDLLTRDEERVDTRTAQYRFDIGLLAERVVAVTDWMAQADQIGSLPIG